MNNGNLGPTGDQKNATTSEVWVATHGKKFLDDARERLMIGSDPKQWSFRG